MKARGSSPLSPTDMDIPVVHIDDHVVAINKPPGVLVHTFSHQSETDTVVSWARELFPEIAEVGDDLVHRPGVVHRLDRETSGVLLLARSQEFYTHIKEQFLERQVHKVYLGIVHGEVAEEGIIDAAIGLVRGSTRRSTHGQKMRKEAITSYKPLKVFEWKGFVCTLLEITPHTGRTHQIRVHMNSINHPIVGDKLYSPKKNKGVPVHRHLLHAFSISFFDLTGKRRTIEAPLWSDINEFVSL